MAKSHPTYDSSWYYEKYGKAPESFEVRNKDFKTVELYSKEDIERQEASAKIHGRGWWYFAGVAFRTTLPPTWIEQYRVYERGKENERY